MASIEGLQHIGVFVNDMERSLKFYTEVLGFELIHETADPSPEGDVLMRFVRLGDCTLELVHFPHELDRTDGWVDHIALRVKDIDAVVEKLKAQGVPFEEDTYKFAPYVFPPNGNKWILFRGPDGEHLELNEMM